MQFCSLLNKRIKFLFPFFFLFYFLRLAAALCIIRPIRNLNDTIDLRSLPVSIHQGDRFVFRFFFFSRIYQIIKRYFADRAWRTDGSFRLREKFVSRLSVCFIHQIRINTRTIELVFVKVSPNTFSRGGREKQERGKCPGLKARETRRNTPLSVIVTAFSNRL